MIVKTQHTCPLCDNQYEKIDPDQLTDEEKFICHWEGTLGREEAEKSWKIKQSLAGKRIETHYARGDIQGYISQVDGSWIDSRSKHRDHLKRHRMIEVGNDVPMKQPEHKATKDPRMTEAIARQVYKKLKY